MNFLTYRAIVHKGEHRPYLFGVKTCPSYGMWDICHKNVCLIL